MGSKVKVLVGVLAAIAVLALAGQAAAEYPPADGAVVVASANSTPATNESVVLTATVVDAEGGPVAGAECTWAVTDQPGADASAEEGPFTTDSEGNVSTTVDTGSTEGTVVVEATCGQLSAVASLVVGGEEAAEPPAALPDTGSGGGTATHAMIWVLIAGGLSVLLSAGGLLGRRVLR